MKIFARVGLVLFVLVGIWGCGMLDNYGRREGAPEGYTQVNFSTPRSPVNLMDIDGRGLVQAMSGLPGGVMIYAMGTAANSFATNFFLSDELTRPPNPFQLPNGNYKFYAFGFGNLSLGSVKCGLGEGGGDIALTGGSKTINITLSTAGCSAGSPSPFAAAASFDGGQLKPLQVYSCFPNANFDTQHPDYGCSGNGNSDNGSINVESVQFFLSVFIRDPDGSLRMTPPDITRSAFCMNVDSSSGADTGFRFPTGTNASVLPIPGFLKAFDADSCGGNLIGGYEFKSGLLDGQSLFARKSDFTAAFAAGVQSAKLIQGIKYVGGANQNRLKLFLRSL